MFLVQRAMNQLLFQNFAHNSIILMLSINL